MSQNIPLSSGGAPISQHQQQHQPASNMQTQNAGQAQPFSLALGPNGPVNMSALDGISPQQLAAIAQLFQSGQIPLPPPPPTSSLSTAAASPPRIRATPVGHPDVQDVEMDKEEGEVEDSEVGDADGSSSRAFLHEPPKGPRGHIKSPRPSFQITHDATHPPQSNAPSQYLRPAPVPRKPSSLSVVTSANQLNGIDAPSRDPSTDTSINAFIVEMDKAGYTFDQVAREVSNVSALRHLYRKLGIASDAASPTANAQTAANAAQNERKVSVTKRLVTTKAPVAQDRSAYLAKLQAAKNKKSEPTAPTPPKGEEASQPEPVPSNVPTNKTANQTPRKVNVATDVIKQRLEALRAQQAAKKNAMNLSSGNQTPSSLPTTPVQHKHAAIESKTGLGNGLADAAARAAEQAAESASQSMSGSPSQTKRQTEAPTRSHGDSASLPTEAQTPSASPTLNRTLGLPGLFTTLPGMAAPLQPRTNSAASQSPYPKPIDTIQQPTSTRSQTHLHGQHAYQASNYGNTAPPPSFRTQSYNSGSFYQPNRSDEPEESFVIDLEDSEDEESGDDMEIDSSDHDEPPAPRGDSRDNSALLTPSLTDTAAVVIGMKRKKFDELSMEEMKSRIAVYEAAKRSKSGSDDAVPLQPETGRHDAAAGFTASSSASATATPVGSSFSPDNRPLSASATSGKDLKAALQRRLAAAEREIAATRQGTGIGEASNDKLQASESATVVPEVATENLSQPSAESALAEFETAPPAQEILSDDDEDMYVEPVTGHTNDENAVAISEDGLSHDLANEQQTSATMQLPTERTTSAQDFTESWSDEDEAMYEPNPTSANAHVQAVSPHINEPITVAGSCLSADDDDDDLDDIYEPADLGVQSQAATANAPVEVSSDDDEEEVEGDGTGDDNDDDDDDEDEEEEGAVDDDDSDTSEDDAMDTSEDLEQDADGQLQQGLDQASASPPEFSSEESAEEELTNENIASEQYVTQSDLAPELQPSTEELAVPSEEPRKVHAFKAYESPLTKFKDFRYHSDYLKIVPGGYKSLTYCHKIDPEIPLCRYEADGGACYDKTCQYQHFRSMGLTDNDLLRLMGTERIPAQTPDEDKSWKIGLNAVVQELRNKNESKDIAAIARRIAEYRREFRSDPSKTLMLD